MNLVASQEKLKFCDAKVLVGRLFHRGNWCTAAIGLTKRVLERNQSLEHFKFDNNEEIIFFIEDAFLAISQSFRMHKLLKQHTKGVRCLSPGTCGEVFGDRRKMTSFLSMTEFIWKIPKSSDGLRNISR